jgi:hypothetical protein
LSPGSPIPSSIYGKRSQNVEMEMGTFIVVDSMPSRRYQSPMTNLNDLTTNQLRRIIAIKEKLESLQGQLDALTGGGESASIPNAKAPKRRRMSASARARIAAGARARWARVKGTQAAPQPARKKDRRTSPAVRAKLAAIAKARWAKVRAEGKKTL